MGSWSSVPTDRSKADAVTSEEADALAKQHGVASPVGGESQSDAALREFLDGLFGKVD